MFYEKTIENLVQDYEDIQAIVQKRMENCFKSTTDVPVQYVCISFLRTSLYFDAPKFRISLYGEEDLWGETIAFQDIEADWLFREWEQDTQSEVQRMEEREKLKPLLYYASTYFKYFLVDCDKLDGFEEMPKTKEVYVCFGEYKDWQYPIFIKREEIDIFQNLNEESLEFRKFENKVYRDKHFSELNLTSSSFKDCSFEQSNFEQVVLNDVVFEHCKFKNTNFTQCKMYGITIIDCEFDHCVFQSDEFTLAEITAKTLTGIYKISEFLESKMIDTEFIDCDMEKVEMSEWNTLC